MGALGSLATVGLNVALANEAQRRQRRQINNQRDEDVDKIERRRADEQRRDADRLRQQLARQRARAGAAGLGNSASTTAVLRGITQEVSAADRARREEAAQAIESINRNARSARRNSLLDIASTTARSSFSQTSGRQRRSLLDQ